MQHAAVKDEIENMRAIDNSSRGLLEKFASPCRLVLMQHFTCTLTVTGDLYESFSVKEVMSVWDKISSSAQRYGKV